MYTLLEAAKATGLTKTAIHKSIKNGRISASKNDLGHYVIDPAELHRVYPVNVNNKVESQRQNTPNETYFLQQEIEFLRQQIQQEREKTEREREIARDFSRRLDEEATERRKLSAMLPYKQQEQEDEPKKQASWFTRFLRN